MTALREPSRDAVDRLRRRTGRAPTPDPELTRRLADLRRGLATQIERLQAQLGVCEATLRTTSPPPVRAAPNFDGSRLSAAIDSRAVEVVAAALRRHLARTENHLRAAADGRLVVDSDRLTADVDGRRRLLTPTEWQLLSALLSEPGVVLSRERLAERAWGAGYRTRGSEVEVYISRLRRKLGEGRRGGMIETVRGRGYRFLAEPPSRPE